MKYTNKYGLPQSLVDVIKNKTYDLSESDPKRISVTTLINPPIQRLLQVRHWDELEEDVSEHLWRITGNAYHYILATTTQTDRLIEEKLEEKIGEFSITGRLDLYEKKDKSIEDYKVTSIWNIKLGKKEDWERQLNSYAWLLRKKNYPVDKAYINAIIRDWRRGESFKYNDYPRIPFTRIKVDIWNPERQQSFIEERVKLYKDVLNLPDKELPICSPEERWAKPEAWAVYKSYKGKYNKTATKLCSTEKEAFEVANKIQYKTKIEKRPATNGKCEAYCIVNKFCPYYQEHYK